MPTDNLPFDPAPETDEDFERASSYLKAHFAEWAAANAPGLDGDLGESLIHQKRTYLDGDLTRWTRADLDQILLELHPAKVVMEPDEFDPTLAEAIAFLRFLADSKWLSDDGESVDALVAHLERMGPAFHRAMTDESQFSPGKRFWTAAVREGVQLDDAASVNAFMATYNARIEGPRPEAFHNAFLSGPAGGRPRGGPALRVMSGGRATPPGTPPQPKRSSGKRKRQGR